MARLLERSGVFCFAGIQSKVAKLNRLLVCGLPQMRCFKGTSREERSAVPLPVVDVLSRC